MSNPQLANLTFAAASPSLLASSLPMPSLPMPALASTRYVTPSAPAGVPDAATGPQAEWAAEAIVNLRNVVAGVSCAFLIEGAVALSIYATWNLWHLR